MYCRCSGRRCCLIKSRCCRYRNQGSLLWTGGSPGAGTPKSFLIWMRNVDPGTQMRVTLSNLPVGAWKWGVNECYTFKTLVPLTSAGQITFTMTAAKQQGSVVGPYPNQKVGYTRLQVCASTNNKCTC